MATLITGGSGFIGRELAGLLVARGEKVAIFDVAAPSAPIVGAEYVAGDVAVLSDLLDAVKAHGVRRIAHLGAMLTTASEARPWRSLQVNVAGTQNVYEAARLSAIERVLFASSIAVFGPSASGSTFTDDTPQRPGSVYGCAKQFGESLGRWYATRFGLDVRAVRYPQMIGKGVRAAPHWAPPMIEDVLRAGTHRCVYGADARSIMLYLEDAARATLELLDADPARLSKGAYNVTGLPAAITPVELAAYLRARIPDCRIEISGTGADDGGRTKFDDSRARADWGWNPRYATLGAIVDTFARDLARDAAIKGDRQ
jgi:threonine 3-dehydrogenase